MKNYIITVTCGKYNAPSIYLDAVDDKSATLKAKELSGLGRFDNWLFIPVENKKAKQQKPKRLAD